MRDGGWEGERRGVASQPTRVSFRANKNRWITETVDGASYRTERRPEKPAPALLHWKLIHEKVPWGLVLLLGGGFAMAEASKVSGLSHFLGVKLQALEVLPSFAILVIISTATTFLTEVSSNTAVANIVLPVLSEMAVAMKIHPLYFMMPAVLCCSYAFMLPVATPPNAIVMASSNMKSKDMMLATPKAGPVMVSQADYQWAYSIMDSSRVSTFLISILLIVYGSFRSLNMEQEAREREKEKERAQSLTGLPAPPTSATDNNVQTLDTMQALCLPLGASISLLVMFFFFDSMQMLFAICTAIIATVALAFLLLPMCQYVIRPCSDGNKISFGVCGRFTGAELLSFSLAVFIVCIWVLTGHWLLMDDECQPFLQRFQTSKPMTPYLFEAVEKLLRYLMNRCVKPDLMKCTGPKLLSIDTKKSENLILSKNIDIGFATKRLLGETAITVTERQKLEFIHECRSMLTTMIAKLQEKSPLKQKAVRGLSSLDPCVIQHSPQLAQKRFSFLLEELNHANIINDVLAENAKKEYLHFCNLKKSELQEIFRPCDQFSDEVGLDTIYGSFLIGEANYKHLWEVIKICLVLSHGNATVEGGFSVNKSLLVENMHEKTVIAQRHIHDEIQEAGGIKNIHISKKMLDYVRGARKRYHEYLEMKKQEKSEKDKKKAEKRKLDIQVKDLEGERKKLMMATEEKREAIDVELQELKKKQASLY
uniref:Uncharacterized protein n=1 Tax=Timema monikensis TaxID=170555 RepID=A0A7R9E604_9NEOP|nr:unnamed protein product [Timema monikensis]